MLTLLLTFGIVYPVLAIALLMNVYLNTLVLQLSIHYHSLQVQLLNTECQSIWMKILHNELIIFHKVIFGSRTLVFLFCCFFISCAILEMCAFKNVTIGFIIITVLLLCTISSTKLCKYIQNNILVNSTKDNRQISISGMEMNIINHMRMYINTIRLSFDMKSSNIPNSKIDQNSLGKEVDIANNPLHSTD